MTHPKTIFVSDDARLRDGKLDPTDKEIMRQASADGKPFVMTSEEAVALSGPDVSKPSSVEREVGRYVSGRAGATGGGRFGFGPGGPDDLDLAGSPGLRRL